MKYLTTILAAIGLACLLGGVGPALDQWNQPTPQEQEAQRAAQAEARFIQAVRKMCGENAGWVLTDIPNQFQCATHRGVVRATKGML